MRKNWMKWLAVLTMPVAVLMIVGACSTGSGDDDDDNGTPTPSSSATPTPQQFSAMTQVFSSGGFGYENPGTPAIRAYDVDVQGSVVTQDPFVQIVLLTADQMDFCTLAIEGTDVTAWTTATLMPLGGTGANGTPLQNAAFEYNMANATTTNVDCAGKLDPAIWTATPEEGLKNASWGLAGHNTTLDQNLIDGMEQSVVQQADQMTWDNEWLPNLVGGAVLLGSGGTVSNAWLLRAAMVDGNFQIVDGSFYDTATVDVNDGTEPDGAYLISSPYVLNFGGDEQALANALLGQSALTAAPQPGQLVDLDRLDIPTAYPMYKGLDHGNE